MYRSNCLGWLSVIALLVGSRLYGATQSFGVGENLFAIEFVDVRDAGNPNDPRAKLPLPDLPSATSDVDPAGGVDYEFGISKFEISLEVLEKVDDQAGFGFELDTGYDRWVPGIEPNEEWPALISWTEAARMVNWLNESEGYSPAYKFFRNPGDEFYKLFSANVKWTEEDAGYDPAAPYRNSLARYAIANMDEWHKAAYYDPEKDGGYWLYTTGSDESPAPISSGIEPGTAVFGQPREIGPATVELAGAASPYGVVGMGGNAPEWTENVDESNPDLSTPQGRDSRGARWDFKSPARADENLTARLNTHSSDYNFRIVDLGAPVLVSGDFDNDGALTASDIDILSEAVLEMSDSLRFDLNGDGVIDSLDRTEWVEQLANTNFGDADLDGEVAFSDFLDVATAFNEPAGWAGGDFDGNGMTEFQDFLLLANNFGASNATEDVAAVPEPSSLVLCSVLVGLLALRRRRR